MDDTPCTYRISIKVIIHDDNDRILLVRDGNGYWELPGGGLEHGEDTKLSLAREITEETGLNVDWISDHPVGFWTIRKEVGSPRLKWFAFVAYQAKVSGTIQLSTLTDEAQEAQYFTQPEISKLQLHDNSKPYFETKPTES